MLYEEARLLRDQPSLIPTRTRSNRSIGKIEQANTWGSTISTSIGYATSYLSFSRTTTRTSDTTEVDMRRGYWGRTAANVLTDSKGHAPGLLVALGEAILAGCTSTEGVFRRTSNVGRDTPRDCHLLMSVDTARPHHCLARFAHRRTAQSSVGRHRK